jgi:hypothetical protein
VISNGKEEAAVCGQTFAKIQYFNILAVCGWYFQALVISNGKEEAAVCGPTFAKIQYLAVGGWYFQALVISNGKEETHAVDNKVHF